MRIKVLPSRSGAAHVPCSDCRFKQHALALASPGCKFVLVLCCIFLFLIRGSGISEWTTTATPAMPPKVLLVSPGTACQSLGRDFPGGLLFGLIWFCLTFFFLYSFERAVASGHTAEQRPAASQQGQGGPAASGHVATGARLSFTRSVASLSGSR